jgi:hypothetical protein
VPTSALVALTSVLLMVPLAFTSLRKLDEVTGAATWALTEATSVWLTIPLPVVSPTKMPIDAESVLLLFPAESVTLVRLAVITWALVTPVRLTI